MAQSIPADLALSVNERVLTNIKDGEAVGRCAILGPARVSLCSVDEDERVTNPSDCEATFVRHLTSGVERID